MVLLLLSTGIIVIALSPAIAANGTVVTQFDLGDPDLHRLVTPCLDCHTVDNSTAQRVGPTLNNIVGRRAASIRDYEYSSALYVKAASGLVWSEDSLHRFLELPQTMAPGNAMTFKGIPDVNDRAKIITWLATGPAPLPSEALVNSSLKNSPQVKAVLQIKADAEYGEFLSGMCLTCHFASGSSGSIPPISGLPAEYLVNALLEYQQGMRTNRIMQVMSKPLGTDELAALAYFFANRAP